MRGSQRPWLTSSTALCGAHDYQRSKLGVTVAELTGRPDVVGLPSLGLCAVAACTRDRVTHGPYCSAHRLRVSRELRQDPQLDLALWHRTASAPPDTGAVSLRALHPRVSAELLYGLQARTAADMQTLYWRLRPTCDLARALQARSLADLPAAALRLNARAVLTGLLREVRRFGADPELERHKDVWDLYTFSHTGNLNFTAISQPWLRQATQWWALQDLSTRRGGRAASGVQSRVNSIAMLSDSPRLHRADHGARPQELGRHDITMFCNRLAYLAQQGTISASRRVVHSRQVRGVLTTMRTGGLGRPG